MPLAGAYKALKENGRTEIKLYSIDISNRFAADARSRQPVEGERGGGSEAYRRDQRAADRQQDRRRADASHLRLQGGSDSRALLASRER